jgi:nucleoside phosphorylase
MITKDSTQTTVDVCKSINAFLDEMVENGDVLCKLKNKINQDYEALKPCLENTIGISEVCYGDKKIDILILTATPLESKVLLTKLQNIQTLFNDIETDDPDTASRTYHIGALIFSVSCSYNVVHIETGKGSEESYSATKAAIKEWNPKLIVAVGVAFSSDYEEQKLGDVLFMKLGVPFRDGKNAEDRYELSSDKFIYSPDIRIQRSIKNISDGLSSDFSIRSGLTAIVDFTVDEINFKSKIFDSISAFNPIGGEMEAYGIYKAASEGGVKYCAMLKGICDWGVAKNDENINDPQAKDKIQLYAANNACDIMLRLLNPLHIKSMGIKSTEDLNTITHLENQVSDDVTLFRAIMCVSNDLSKVNDVIQRYKKESCKHFIVDLKKHGYINVNNNLTEKGVALIYKKTKKQFEVSVTKELI